jgi:hypothetical protein
MKLSSEELKQLYRVRTARASRLECPSADAFVNAASGEVNVEERTRLVDHLVSCSDCAQEYQLIFESATNLERDRAVDRPVSSARVRTRAGWAGVLWIPRWRVIATLTLLLLIGGSLVVWRAGGPAQRLPESVRGARPVLIDVQPPDHAVLDAAPRQLAWSPVESADSYRVALFDYLSTPLWESDPTTVPSVAVPDSVRQKLDRGRSAYWRISVRKGIENFRSELFQFSIRTD